MKRLVIIVEGDTEIEFVNTILVPYFQERNIYNISTFKIKHSKGGLTKYSHLQTDIINILYESNIIVTTFIDYYALPKDFPGFSASKAEPNIYERLSFLERCIIEDIEAKQGHKILNLIPYLQLHEFEALCFSSYDGFELNYSESEANHNGLREIIRSFDNPENINDGPTTAPSKRLKSLIPGYHKIVDGNIIIETIGLSTVINKCPKFKSWLEELVIILTE